jgi:hypothetical protein
MTHLNKFLPTVFGIYTINAITYSWLVPGVLAQDDSSGKEKNNFFERILIMI